MKSLWAEMRFFGQRPKLTGFFSISAVMKTLKVIYEFSGSPIGVERSRCSQVAFSGPGPPATDSRRWGGSKSHLAPCRKHHGNWRNAVDDHTLTVAGSVVQTRPWYTSRQYGQTTSYRSFGDSCACSSTARGNESPHRLLEDKKLRANASRRPDATSFRAQPSWANRVWQGGQNVRAYDASRTPNHRSSRYGVGPGA